MLPVCRSLMVAFLMIAIGKGMDLSSLRESNTVAVGVDSHMEVKHGEGQARRGSLVRREDEIASAIASTSNQGSSLDRPYAKSTPHTAIAHGERPRAKSKPHTAPAHNVTSPKSKPHSPQVEDTLESDWSDRFETDDEDSLVRQAGSMRFRFQSRFDLDNSDCKTQAFSFVCDVTSGIYHGVEGSLTPAHAASTGMPGGLVPNSTTATDETCHEYKFVLGSKPDCATDTECVQCKGDLPPVCTIFCMRNGDDCDVVSTCPNAGQQAFYNASNATDNRNPDPITHRRHST